MQKNLCDGEFVSLAGEPGQLGRVKCEKSPALTFATVPGGSFLVYIRWHIILKAKTEKEGTETVSMDDHGDEFH